MRVRPEKIGEAQERLVSLQLNAAEQLRLAERLMDDVLTSLGPIDQARMCVAEGLLTAAHVNCEAARGEVEGWKGDDLPSVLDLG